MTTAPVEEHGEGRYTVTVTGGGHVEGIGTKGVVELWATSLGNGVDVPGIPVGIGVVPGISDG